MTIKKIVTKKWFAKRLKEEMVRSHKLSDSFLNKFGYELTIEMEYRPCMTVGNRLLYAYLKDTKFYIVKCSHDYCGFSFDDNDHFWFLHKLNTEVENLIDSIIRMQEYGLIKIIKYNKN